MLKQSIIVDLEDTKLSTEEQALISHPCVGGVLLFSRNYESREQLTELTQSIREQNSNIITMVDQEGGRIQRFRKEFTALPSMRYWGNLYEESRDEAIESLREMTIKMVSELQSVGVDLSLAPVLDLDRDLSEVISDRSFGVDPEVVSCLGEVVINAMKELGMRSVAKHFPGHGGVESDSHYEISVDERTKNEIWEQDMQPFGKLANCYDAVMPAHVIYPMITNEVVTYSSVWLKDVLRDELGFKGVVMSDDLTMFAASQVGDYEARATAALNGGCDLLIAANNRAGAKAILSVAEQWNSKESQQRIDHFIKTVTNRSTTITSSSN
jgi:beta-N-acetylhexosaminidase